MYFLLESMSFLLDSICLFYWTVYVFFIGQYMSFLLDSIGKKTLQFLWRNGQEMNGSVHLYKL